MFAAAFSRLQAWYALVAAISLAFVLTQCPPRSPRVDETRTGLAALGLIAEPPIVSRADHQDAMAAGMGVTEFNPEGAAAHEIRQLFGWIDKKLEPKVKR